MCGAVPFAVGPGGGEGVEVAPTLDVRSRNGAMQNQIGAVVLHADAVGRDGVSRNAEPDAEGNVRCRDAGLGISDTDAAYSLTTGAPHAVLAQPFDVAHTLRGEGFDASEDGTGRGTPLVIADAMPNAEMGHDCSTTLKCAHDGPPILLDCADPITASYSKHGGASAGKDCEPRNVVLAFSGKDHGADCGDDVAPTLRSMNAVAAVLSPFGEVRRLTPRECSRLMGFPDDWAKLSDADGPQYAAYGNSMAVPVISWIGARIEAVLNDMPYVYGIPEAARDEIEGRNATTCEAAAFAENGTGCVWMTDAASPLVTGGGKPGQGYPAVLVRTDG